MSAQTEVITKLEGAVGDAKWNGLTKEEIQAIVTAALLKMQ